MKAEWEELFGSTELKGKAWLDQQLLNNKISLKMLDTHLSVQVKSYFKRLVSRLTHNLDIYCIFFFLILRWGPKGKVGRRWKEYMYKASRHSPNGDTWILMDNTEDFSQVKLIHYKH